MTNRGRKITDFYCNGYAGRRYDLADSRIEAEGHDWIVIRLQSNDVELLSFKHGEKEELLDEWCKRQ
jgi:hypothetical protein